jgi:hypothetical protein
VARFEHLVTQLRATAPSSLPDLPADSSRRRLLPFYEAYFSNFIEGTEFTLEEAAAIIFRGQIPESRPSDAHDVTGTYEIVSDSSSRGAVATDGDAMTSLVRHWHASVMCGRPDKRPGEFKHLANCAGSTEFVAPELVEGTLRRAFQAGAGLIDPFHRAVYMMFVVASPTDCSGQRLTADVDNSRSYRARRVGVTIAAARLVISSSISCWSHGASVRSMRRNGPLKVNS